MPSEPLTLLILLFFLALVLAVLLVWFMLTLGDPRPSSQPAVHRLEPEKPTYVAEPVLHERPSLSNDAYRGAKRPSTQERLARSDAFETFAQSSKDDLKF